MAFETIEVNGQRYFYDGNHFFDEYFLILQGAEQKEVVEAYFAQTDYTKFNAEALLLFIKKLKANDLIFRAKKAIDYALEKFKDDGRFLYRVLPLYTSCCREMGKPKEAIAAAQKYAGENGYSAVLCTSLAAAYCDIQDYENAKRFVRMAYAKQGGAQGYQNEVSMVMLRIRKETGEEFFEEEDF